MSFSITAFPTNTEIKNKNINFSWNEENKHYLLIFLPSNIRYESFILYKNCNLKWELFHEFDSQVTHLTSKTVIDSHTYQLNHLEDILKYIEKSPFRQSAAISVKEILNKISLLNTLEKELPQSIKDEEKRGKI